MTKEDERRLRDCPAAERDDFVHSQIEEVHPQEWGCGTDKAWEGIHRAFASSELEYDYLTPLHGVILGGEPLYFADWYHISWKSPVRVREIAAALAGVAEQSFRRFYYAIDQTRYEYPLDEEDFEYCWSNVGDLKAFYDRAAKAGRSVIFTVAE